MKKTKKILALALAAVMLVCTTVAATVAYLQSTDSVKNTFTVGKVEITLDETDTDGSKTNVTPGSDPVRDKANAYKLYPGQTYEKDPIVHVDAESEDCYVFVKVVNEISAIESTENGYTNIADQILANGWKLLSGNVYYYIGKTTDANYDVDGAVVEAGANLNVFEGFKISGTVDNATLATYAPVTTGKGNEAVTTYKTIEITAYAVQVETFATAVAAWNATFGK